MRIHSNVGQLVAYPPMVDSHRQFPAAHGAINRYMQCSLSWGLLIAGFPTNPALRKPDVERIGLGVTPAGPGPNFLPREGSRLSLYFRF
jgi:ribosomal protein L16/L10AE